MRWGIRSRVLVALAVVLGFGLLASYLVTSRLTRSAVLEAHVEQARRTAALLAEHLEHAPEGLQRAGRLLERLRDGVAPDRLYLLGPDGRPRHADDEARRSYDRLVGEGDPVELDGGGLRHTVLRREGREPVLAVLVPLRESAASSSAGALRVCLLSPLGAPHERAARIETLYILFSVTILALASILGYVLLGRLVVRPVQRLTGTLDRVGGGELEGAPEQPWPGGELGRLYEAFDRMTRQLAEDRDRIGRQVRELEAANRELAATQEQLVRTEKLASAGELAAGIAHEIGNPIATLRGYLEMIADAGLPDEQRREFAREMEGALDRIDGTIRDLLDFARSGDEEAGGCDAAAVVEATRKLVAAQKRFRELTLELDVVERGLEVAIPAGRLEQVLVNLLLNAADASPSGGTIRVEAGRDASGERVRIAVRDEGEGIDPADRARIFDPFFTTKDPGEGTGLGLPVCHGILRSWGGGLEVDSEPGEGTTFTVVLPAAETDR